MEGYCAMNEKIEKLERELRHLRLAFWLTAALTCMVVAWFQSKKDNDRILRDRGLIIEDQNGRERILLGTRIPSVSNRVRTDLARVQEAWGKQFPKEYLKWYHLKAAQAHPFHRPAAPSPADKEFLHRCNVFSFVLVSAHH